MSNPLKVRSERGTDTTSKRMSIPKEHENYSSEIASSSIPSSSPLSSSSPSKTVVPSSPSKASSSPSSLFSSPSSSQSSQPGPTNMTSVVSNYTTGARVTADPNNGSSNAAGTAVAIIITVGILVAFLAVILFFLKKKGKLRSFTGFHPLRTRRSSTTDSTRVLPDSEQTGIPDLKFAGNREQDDMFTIEEPDDQPDYIYDEVFGQGGFEDERTKSSVRDLYSTTTEGNGEDDEMLDFDFETLGIDINNYKIGEGRTATYQDRQDV